METFTVNAPPNAPPGSTFSAIYNGQSYNITVPNGLAPGQSIVVNVNVPVASQNITPPVTTGAGSDIPQFQEPKSNDTRPTLESNENVKGSSQFVTFVPQGSNSICSMEGHFVKSEFWELLVELLVMNIIIFVFFITGGYDLGEIVAFIICWVAGLLGGFIDMYYSIHHENITFSFNTMFFWLSPFLLFGIVFLLFLS